ncbi:MAG: glycosyltransferase family 2 protein [Gaiellaceae bacterium]
MPAPPESVSVVVPVYNGSATLEPLVRRLETVLGASAPDYELVLVNDGSSDGSWQRIVELSAQNDRVRGLDLARNYGQHNALLAGLRAARNEVVVTLDDDLQNPPEEIPRLLERLRGGADVVYGLPRQRQHGLWRNVSARLTRFALRGAVGIELADKVSTFRAFRTGLRETFAFFQGPYVTLDVLLSWATTRFEAIPVEHDERAGGTSAYTFRKLASQALTMLTGFSTRPLRIATLIGLATILFGFAIFAYVVIRYIFEGFASIPGFPFLASAIAIFSGAQLLALGVIGEYIARMHVRLMDRPTYAVREEVGAGARAGRHAG